MLTQVKAREQVTVSSTAIALTTTNFVRTHVVGTQPAFKAHYAEIQVTGANVRVRFDGEDPDSTTGQVWYSGDIKRVWGAENLALLKFIRDDSTDAVLEVDYFGGGTN